MEKKQNVPALRFQGFSGEWEKKRLKEMGSSFTYGLNAAATTYDGQHKYLRITDIDDESRKFSGKELTSPNVDLSNISDYKLQKNDIVFARTGASVGKTYLYDTSDGDVYYAGFLIRVKIDSKYDANFIFQKTLSSDYSNFVVVTSQRSGQPGINAQEYAALEMLVPELGEQKKIGKFLANFDKNIFVCGEKIQKLQQFRQAMLTKLFPREGAAEPELRFRGFSGKWKRQKLADVVDVQNGYDYKSLGRGTIPVYGTGGYMLSVDKALSYDKDAIGIGRKGTIDKPFILKAPFWTVDTLFYAIPREINDINFVLCLFQKIDWKSKNESTGVPSLSKTTIEGVKRLIPSAMEQKVIGDFFYRLDRYISLQQKKLERMQRLKAALLDKMFV